MEQILERSRNRNILRFVRSLPCRACGGTRLRPEALAVTLPRSDTSATCPRSRSTASPDSSGALTFTPAEAPVGEPIRAEMRARVDLLAAPRASTTSRSTASSTTLSGGEAQRLRLASQVGADFGGVLYVLDEPSIGLHPLDRTACSTSSPRCATAATPCSSSSTTTQTMRRADWLIDVGPGAGEHGGEVLYSGPVAAPRARGADRRSRTRAFLAGDERVAGARRPAAPARAPCGWSRRPGTTSITSTSSSCSAR